MGSCRERKFPQIGTLLREKRGVKDLEFTGKDPEGKIILRDPITGVTYLVKPEEIIWEPITKLKPIRP